MTSYTYVVFSSPEYDDVKYEIMKSFSPGTCTEGIIQWKFFPDGTPNILIENIETIRDKHVVFITSLTSESGFMAKFGVMFALPRYLSRSLTIILPFFPTATMERVNVEGEIATSMTLCRFLSAIPLTVSGPARIVIFDLHELAVRFQLRDNLIPVMASGQTAMLKHLSQSYDLDVERFVAVFPDAGAAKRYSGEYKNFEILYCVKERLGDRRKITLEKGVDLSGRNCLIVDDLIQSGGTIFETVRMLKEQNVSSVGVMVTHPVFPNGSWKKFLDIGLRFFYTCNTVPETVLRINNQPPFVVVSITKPIVDLITRTANVGQTY